MKVVAFNSSPNMARGGTALILAPFLEGMEEAGAEVELFYLRKLEVKPCTGCFSCWLKTPGKCVQKDDMEALLPIMGASDVLVFATPLYVDGMTGMMKTLVDRSIPLLEPMIETVEGRSRHPRRDGFKAGKGVLVSVSAFPELENFDPLVAHVEAICANLHLEFAGALLRPYAAVLPMLKERGLPVDGVFEAAREAGRQLVRDGKMSRDTLAAVSREVVPRELVVQGLNAHIKQILDGLEKH